jgi:transcription elongation factor GreB
VRYLSDRLKKLHIAADRPADSQAIFFGAWFSIEDDDGRTQQLRIVGPDETDAALGYISIDSPLARAALKKRADDDCEPMTPARAARYHRAAGDGLLSLTASAVVCATPRMPR